jgi:hypothetical protein
MTILEETHAISNGSAVAAGAAIGNDQAKKKKIPELHETTQLLGEEDTENHHVMRGSNEEAGEEEFENPDRPRGIKFAILLLCILLGDFFVGYVC